MSRDTPAPDDAAELLKLRDLSERATAGPWHFLNDTGHVAAGFEPGLGPDDELNEDDDGDAYEEALERLPLCVMLPDGGPCGDDDAEFIVACVNHVRAKLTASDDPLAPTADAIRRAKVEAWEKAIAVLTEALSRTSVQNKRRVGGPSTSLSRLYWQGVKDGEERSIRLLREAMDTAIRTDTTSDIPPGGLTSPCGVKPEEPSRGVGTPMTLGSSDALAVMEAMGKALEPFATVADEWTPGYPDWTSISTHLELGDARRASEALAAFRAWRAGGGDANRQEAGDGG